MKQLHWFNTKLKELVALTPGNRPIRISPPYDDAPQVRKLVEQPLYGCETNVFIIDQDGDLFFGHFPYTPFVGLPAGVG